MSVGVIVPNLNQKQLVTEFLAELSRQSYQDFVGYVFDNGSELDERVDELTQQYSWLKIVQLDENLGFTGGNNAAIEQALNDGHEYIWIVNNDVRLDPNCLNQMVGYLSADNNAAVGIVGPKIYYEKERNKIWFAGGKIEWSRPGTYTVCSHFGEGQIDNGQYDEIREVDFITGASMLCRAEVLRKTKGFDDRYFAYFEDADLSLRVRQLGYKLVYYPLAVMYHMVGMLSGVTSPRSSYYQTRNSLLFVKEWGPDSSYYPAMFYALQSFAKSLIKLFIPSKNMIARAQILGVLHFTFKKFGGPIGF